MKLFIKDYGAKERQEISDLIKIEIERDNDILEPKKETYLLSLYTLNGYQGTKTIKDDSQDLEIIEELDKQAHEIRSAILRERKGLKSLINDMIFNYEASANGTKDSTLKAYYLTKKIALTDLLQEIKKLEDIEAEEEAGGEDYSTAVYKELKKQNGED